MSIHRVAEHNLYKIAGGGSTGTGAIATPIEIDARNYDRAMFICARGAEAGGTKGQFSASVYAAASSGGTYSLITGSLGTSGTASTNKALLIDVAVPVASNFLKIYGTASTTGTSAIPVVITAELYRGSRIKPPSQDITVVYA